MSDMQSRGMPPQGMTDPKQSMSMFNPMDISAKMSTGDVNPQMPFGEFLQKNFGITMDMPLAEAAQKLKANVGMGTMQGKLQAAGGGMPQRPTGQAPVSSMQDLASRIQTQG